MNDMIERVAKAICLVHNTDIKRYKNYISAAKVAIEAMREPTEEMIDAWYVNNYGDPVPGWQAMIDKALE